jgi:hypothetical protein
MTLQTAKNNERIDSERHSNPKNSVFQQLTRESEPALDKPHASSLIFNTISGEIVS